MKKAYFIISIILVFTGCNEPEKKSYEDYDEGDFIEVQGIITKTNARNTLQNHIVTDIHFIYNLNLDKPSVGYELKSPYMLDEGEPVIILVHKEDKNVSFFGARGIIEEEVLLDYLKKCEEIGGGYYGLDD